MPNITTTTAAVFIPALWSVETLRATEVALVAAPLVKRFDALVTSRGNAIHIPNVSNLVANPKTSNTEVQTQAITETETLLNIDKWYEASFRVEDMAATQSNYDLRAEYSTKAGYAIAKQVDTDVLGLYADFTNVAVGTYNTAIDEDTILDAVLALDENDIPMEDRYLVINPAQKNEIMKIDKFVRKDYVGQYQTPGMNVKGPNTRFLWGDIYGYPVYYTNNTPVTVATPAQTHCMLFQKEAMALALQQAPRMQAAYWLPALAWYVVTDVLYGVKALRTNAGVEIKA